jgi:hypothetical protein
LISATLGVSFDPDDDREGLAQKNMANLPLRSLLIPTIVIPIANYAILAFLDISLMALLPLFLSTPVYLGGLGFTPASIGRWLALFGITNGLLQALFFAKFVDWLGPKRMFCVAVSCFVPAMIVFPIMSWLVRSRGMADHVITFALLSQLMLMVIWDMAFGAYCNNEAASVITSNPLQRVFSCLSRPLLRQGMSLALSMVLAKPPHPWLVPLDPP